MEILDIARKTPPKRAGIASLLGATINADTTADTMMYDSVKSKFFFFAKIYYQ